MKSLYYFLFFVCAFALTVQSCKKDKSAKQILTSVSWKISSTKINGVAQVIDVCEKDDFLTFTADGNYTYNVGAVTCYDGETTYSGTWILSADEKTITVDGSAASVKITESQIVVTVIDGSDTMEMIYIPK